MVWPIGATAQSIGAESRPTWESDAVAALRQCCDGALPKMILFVVVAVAVAAAQSTHATGSSSTLSFRSHRQVYPSQVDFHVPSTPTFTLAARPTTVYRPRSPAAVHLARLRSLHSQQSQIIDWDQLDILGPDIEDAHTVAQLARMTGNAYALPGQKNWYEVDPIWNNVRPSSIPSQTKFTNYNPSTELPLRMGRRRQWLPGTRIPLFRQLYSRSLHQGHNSAWSHIKQGQIQR
jgi:hypothetical protein